jgi:RNA polymerase-binding transcription factor DksA
MSSKKLSKDYTDTFQPYHRKLKQELTTARTLIKRISECDKANPLYISQIKKKRRRVENALHRLIDGTYGTCLSCGNEIGTKRLNILPYAELCLSCQQRKEIGSL